MTTNLSNFSRTTPFKRNGVSVFLLTAGLTFMLAGCHHMSLPGHHIYFNNSSDYERESITGLYVDEIDGSSLRITKISATNYRIEISLFRLTSIDDATGVLKNQILNFTGTDASGNRIGGVLLFSGKDVTLKFLDSTWEYLPNGTMYHFKKK